MNAPHRQYNNNDDNDDAGEGSGLTAESYGAVDFTSEDVWLLRIPPKLAEAFAAAPEGTVLGDLVFTKGGTDARGKTIKPSFSVHVSEELTEATVAAAKAQAEKEEDDNEEDEPPPDAKAAKDKKSSKAVAAVAAAVANLPLHYSLQSLTKKVPVLHPMVRHPTNGSVQVWGTVSRTANVQVQQDARYRALVKDRLVATNITASRFVKPMETSETAVSRNVAASQVPGLAGSTGDGTKSSFGNAVLQFGKRRLEAQETWSSAAAAQGGAASKRARRFKPDQPLRSVVFELFQQQSYWTMKELRGAAVAGGAAHAAARKAETEIREILHEIAVYHRSGEHKTQYELRKEYKQG